LASYTLGMSALEAGIECRAGLGVWARDRNVALEGYSRVDCGPEDFEDDRCKGVQRRLRSVC